MNEHRTSLRSLVDKWLAPTPSTPGCVTHFGHIASLHLRYARLVGGAATAPRAIVFFRHDDGSWYVFPPLQVRPAMSLCYSTR